VLGLFYWALLCWAAGYRAAFIYRLFTRFSVNRTEEPAYFGSTEPGTEQEPIFSVPVLGSFGLVLGSRFFVPRANTVRLRNLRDYSRNLRTRQPLRINSELPGTVRTEHIGLEQQIT
jgi:hypothetical protein